MTTLDDLIFDSTVECLPDITDLIDKQYNGFKKRRSDVRRTLMLGAYLAFYDKHRDGWILPKSVLETFNIRYRTFRKMNDEYPMFFIKDYYYSAYEKKAILWEPTEECMTIMQQAADGYGGSGLYKYLIKSEKKTKDKPAYTLNVKIPKRNMIAARNSLTESGAKYKLNQLILRYSQEKVDKYYKSESCGRYFIREGWSVQTLDRDLREDVFYGYWLYDLANCHIAIAAHYCNHHALVDYAKNTNSVRLEVARDVGITVEEVKKGILSLFNGASTRATKGNSIVEMIGKDRTKALVNHPKVAAIINGLEVFRMEIKKSHPEMFEEGSDSRNVVCNFLMKQEAEILDVMTRFCKPVVLLHDGLISETKADPSMISTVIENETGYRMLVTEKQIGFE